MICRTCKRDLARSDFYWTRQGYRHSPDCKECANRRSIAYQRMKAAGHIKTRTCSVCCDKFPVAEMIDRKCRVCAQAPYLTPKHTPDDRDLWPFNPDPVAFDAFLAQRRTA